MIASRLVLVGLVVGCSDKPCPTCPEPPPPDDAKLFVKIVKCDPPPRELADPTEGCRAALQRTLDTTPYYLIDMHASEEAYATTELLLIMEHRPGASRPLEVRIRDCYMCPWTTDLDRRTTLVHVPHAAPRMLYLAPKGT